jgi:hypothetical protein
MRKRSNRIVRKTSALLTPAEHDSLILNPRIHLAAILERAIQYVESRLTERRDVDGIVMSSC